MDRSSPPPPSSPHVQSQSQELLSPRSQRLPRLRGELSSNTGSMLPSSSIPDLLSSQLPQDPSVATTVIWGTTINIQDVMTTFKRFLEGFKLRLTNETRRPNDNNAFYPEYFARLHDTRNLNLNLNAQYLLVFPGCTKLYNQLVRYPQEIVSLMDHVATELFLDMYPEMEEEEAVQIKVHPFNLSRVVNMRELNPSDMDQLVCVKGLAVRASTIIPDMKQAFFRCSICEFQVAVGVDRGHIAEPSRCGNNQCRSANSMEMVHNRCVFADKQIYRLQETPDDIPDGQTPHSVSLCVYDDLVDVMKPGDRVQVTGVYRGVPIRLNGIRRTVRTIFKTYLDVVHIQLTDKKRLRTEADIQEANEYVETDASDADVEQRVRNLASQPNLYQLLAHSIAPSIFEHVDVKKGILLQLFGGANKTFGNSGAPKTRGDINVLLVGDPSTSKSQLLLYAHKIAPRGIYTSGKGSSAVGLTAYVTRDPDSKQMVLESGALVLSDGGICCIDEFDKMSDSTRSVLHEVMEQQTISIAKAGIITTLNARTSILACANPIHSRWNPQLAITENIDLPPTLLSRFDLLYLMLDKVDETFDRLLAKHLVSLYVSSENISHTNAISTDMLTKYISYARDHIQPVLTDDAARVLVDAYVKLRKLGQNGRITATTRQLESLIRLAEAHARMRLSPDVLESDVEEAVRLLREAMKESATDPRTGLIDMDLLATGISMTSRHHLDALKHEVRNLIAQHASSTVRWTVLQREINSQSSVIVSHKDFDQVMNELETEQFIKVTGGKGARTIRRLGARATQPMHDDQ